MANSSLSIIFFFLLSLRSPFVSAESTHHLIEPQTFIIHVSESYKPATILTHHQWHTTILELISARPSQLLYSYHHITSAFAAHLTPSQVTDLRRLPFVLSILPDLPRDIHTTRTPHFLGLANTSGLWPNSDYASNVTIGVLDTGLWPERRSFSDSDYSPVPSSWKGSCETGKDFPASACNRKIIGARAFYKGYEAAIGKPINETRESKSPRDTDGHGTHTASTAAGSVVSDASFYDYARGVARGMATKARIAVYKICWKSGCFDSDILAAMDQAVADGVDVISLSVGSTGLAPEYDSDSIAIGAFGAMKNGVLVSCSAGNSGPRDFTAVNIAPWILTVGASTIDREFPADVVLGDGRRFNGVSLYSGDGMKEGEYLELVYGGDAGSNLCLEGELNSSKVAGKMVICDRGKNARVAKGNAVSLAKGAGMILANTAASGEELIADSHLIPATMVGQAAGDKIKSYVSSNRNNATATIKFRGTVVGPSPSSPKVASFSSRGPNHLTPEILKPDVIAPGVNILAGWTGSNGPTDLEEVDPRRVEFNIISGTSMSCPHVSGVAALLRSAYPRWSPAAIKSALTTTAYSLDNSKKNITDLATGHDSTPFVHGSGHVDPNKALDPGLVYDIEPSDYVAFLCSIGYDSKRISVFLRGPPAGIDCDAVRLPNPGDLNYPSFAVVFESGKSSSVTCTRAAKNVGASADAVYDVRINAPARVGVSVSPRRLVFSGENQTVSYQVTFAASAAAGNPVVGSSSFGSIEWSDGSHAVRSPIAVRWKKGTVSDHLVAAF